MDIEARIGEALERYARDGFYDGDELTAWCGDPVYRFSVVSTFQIDAAWLPGRRRWWTWSLDRGDSSTLLGAGEWSSQYEADGGSAAQCFVVMGRAHAPAPFRPLLDALADLPLLDCAYCGRVGEHVGSARTANGADVTRWHQVHAR